jgi:hypothetical protein
MHWQSRQPTRYGPPTWELGEGITIPHLVKTACYEMLYRASELEKKVQKVSAGFVLRIGTSGGLL